MEIEGRTTIAADRERVWWHLTDPETLRACISGCEEVTGTPEEGFEAVVRYRVGPLKLTIRGSLEVLEQNPPESCRLEGRGSGGVAGFASGQAVVHLLQHPEGCELSYRVEAKIGGRLGKLGNKVVTSAARSMAESFFERFRTQVESRSA